MFRIRTAIAAWTIIVLAGLSPCRAEEPGKVEQGFVVSWYRGRDFDKLLHTGRADAVDFHNNPPKAVGKTEDISARWQGTLHVPADGEYTFQATSDDGQRVWIDGKRIIDDWELHSATTRTAKVKLDKGEHALKVEYFNGSGDATMRLEWSGPKLKGTRKIRGQYVSAEMPELPLPPDAMAAPLRDEEGKPIARVPGVRGSYYAGTDFQRRVFEQLDREIRCRGNYPYPDGRHEELSVRWTGALVVPRSGKYTFYAGSDDGQRLWIDGELVLDNWQGQGFDFHKAQVKLDKGLHAFRYEHFQGSGPGAVELQWAGPDLERQTISARHLRARPWEGMQRAGEMVVFLAIGHSNMEGRAKKSLAKINPRTMMYDSDGHWRASSQGDRGPIRPLLHELAEAWPEYRFGVAKVAKAASRIQNNWRRGKEPYKTLIRVGRDLSSRYHVAGLIVMQGWLEGGENRHAKESTLFTEHYTAMIRDIREDLDMPDLPVVISLVEYGTSRKRNLEAWTHVRDQMLRLPDKIEHSVLVDSQGLPLVDDHHFNIEGNSRWAVRAVQAIRNAGLMKPRRLQLAFARLHPTADLSVPEAIGPADAIARVEAVVTHHAGIDSADELGSYDDALVLTELEVRKVLDGQLKCKRLLVVQRGATDRKLTRAARLKPGQKLAVTLGSWRAQKKLQSMQMFSDVPSLELPMFYALQAQPLTK